MAMWRTAGVVIAGMSLLGATGLYGETSNDAASTPSKPGATSAPEPVTENQVVTGNVTGAKRLGGKPDAAVPAEPLTAAPASQPAVDGVTIVTTVPGDPGARDGDVLLMLYTGKLEKGGKVFDASDRHGNKPFQFTLGDHKVIKGWEVGCKGMKVGEKRTLIISPELGYGERGAGDDIPANATLRFDVELVGLVRISKPDPSK